jgi:hypothetical protein
VIPGHGPAFTSVGNSIAVARKRLDSFVTNPAMHIKYAAKVLLKFKLLELQSIELPAFIAWARSTPYFGSTHAKHFSAFDFPEWIEHLVQELVRSGAASSDGLTIRNA